MVNAQGTSIEYQPDYLQERAQVYQDAHADGEQIVYWLKRISYWLGAWVTRWKAKAKTRRLPFQRRILHWPAWLTQLMVTPKPPSSVR